MTAGFPGFPASEKIKTIARYLARPASRVGGERLPPPTPALKLCIVIPALAERQRLGAVLESLAQGSRRLAEAEVLVVVNNSEQAPPEILADNLQTLEDLRRYAGPLRVAGLDRCSPGKATPAPRAGVGLARRLGMDTALRRLHQAGNGARAAIACLDADSPVAPGYVDSLLEVFDSAEAPLGGVCAYAHPFPAEAGLARAMVAYELWLRYFVAGLKLAGSLFAFPTIGSCMVTSACGYAAAGGLEPRRAGEDFHFLRKLAKLGGWRPLADIRAATVYPAARVSNRVPFGTGRAMTVCLSRGPEAYLYVAPPAVFFEVKRFFSAAEEGYRDLRGLRPAAAPGLAEFLEAEGAWPVLERFQKTYSSPVHFALAVQHWLDSLRIVRLANRRLRGQGGVWMFDAWREILTGLGRPSLAEGLPAPEPAANDPTRQQPWLERLREAC